MKDIKIYLKEPPATLHGRFLRIFLLPLIGVGYFLMGVSNHLADFHHDHWLEILITPYFIFALALFVQGYIINYTDKNNYIIFQREFVVVKKPFKPRKIIPAGYIHDIYLTRQDIAIKLLTLEKIEAKYFLTFEHIEVLKEAIAEFLSSSSSRFPAEMGYAR